MDKIKRASRRKFHYIYKTTCSVNGKYYYGRHSTDNLDDEYIGSGTYLWNSIRKHGIENFKLEILEYLPCYESLKLREKELITEEVLKEPMCMNLTLGGNGGWHHCNQVGNWQGVSNFSVMWKKYKTDINFRNNYLANQAKALKKSWADGKRIANPEITKRMQIAARSEETQEKKRIIYEAIGHQIGSKNSQFGSIWINKDGIARKIKNFQLEEFVSEGWKRGRK